MSKCEGCPLYDPQHYNETDNPWCVWLGDNVDSCHLTSDHKRFIEAMIRGVFNCGHCGRRTNYRPDEYVVCPRGIDQQLVGLSGFCHKWQERKGDEEDGM